MKDLGKKDQGKLSDIFMSVTQTQDDLKDSSFL